MNLRSLSLMAVVLILAACAEKPAETGGGTTTTAAPPATAGTPTGPAAGSKEDFVQNVGDRVFFDFDKSDIKPEGQTTLEHQAKFLQQYANYTVTVEGHCDDRGTREYNLALGERRANAVKDYLVASGVSASRLSTISYGKERPIVLGSNEAAWSQNRVGISVPQ